MKQPSISVVICTYNNAASLELTLRHLAEQRKACEVPWDILVVDNNCTDRTREVVEARMGKMPVPMRVVSEMEQGLNPARVAGVRNSQGDWIAFIDDDCLLEPDWIHEAAAFITEHPDAGAFGGEVILRWEDDPPPAYVSGYGYAFAETRLGDVAMRRDWLAGAGMVLNRTALDATGWLDGQLLDDRIGHRLVSGGDVELGLRIAERFEIWYAPRCTLQHAIPRRRTGRRYLRRLVFGLGRSSHDVALMQWDSGPAGWWRQAFRRAGGLVAQGVDRSWTDLRHQRRAFDPVLALAFATGWIVGMTSLGLTRSRSAGSRMGRLASGNPREKSK